MASPNETSCGSVVMLNYLSDSDEDFDDSSSDADSVLTEPFFPPTPMSIKCKHNQIDTSNGAVVEGKKHQKNIRFSEKKNKQSKKENIKGNKKEKCNEEYKTNEYNSNDDNNDYDYDSDYNTDELKLTNVSSNDLIAALPLITAKFDELFPFYRLSDRDCKQLSTLVYNELHLINKIFCNAMSRNIEVKIYYFNRDTPKKIKFVNNDDSNEQVSQWNNIIMNEKYCQTQLQYNKLVV